MRLIFSTILAAALVFGGMLFMAGHFESIERTRLTVPMPEGPPAGTMSGTAWRCPEVDRILAAPLPEVFRVVSGELSSVNVDFYWVQVAMMSATYEPGASFAIGDELVCSYAAPREPHEPLRSDQYLQLALVRDVNVEIDLASDIEGWWQVDANIHGSAYFVCRASAFECEFTVDMAE